MSEDPAGARPGAYARWRRWWRERVERAPVVLRVKRHVRQWLGREVRSRVEVRCDMREMGGWHIFPGLLGTGDVVYSFGLGRDIRFELELAREYGVRVYAFDPTPWSVEWLEAQRLPENVITKAIGVAGHDGHADFREPDRPDGSHRMEARPGQTGETVTVRVMRLRSITRMLGHRRIALIKLDVEGAEYDALRELVELDLDVRQILVEFHHRFEAIGNEPTERALRLLRGHGFRIFHISPDGREYSFIRTELASQ